MKLLIKNGLVINPEKLTSEKLDILIENDRISLIGTSITSADAQIIDAQSNYVCPGLVDMHVHLREPGREDEETIYSGTRAAALGGVTSVACMANTDPPIDDRAGVEFIKAKAKRDGIVNVYPIAAITKGLKGEEIAELGDLHRAGAVAVSDDGNCVMNAEVLRRAMEYSLPFNFPIIEHCEDKNLAGDGVMHEGWHSTEFGLRGIPSAAEDVIVARDITLAEMTGAKLHIAHVSSSKSVELIRQAKQRGVRVTCEVTPHHLTLTDAAVATYDSNMKMNPPLRTEADVTALIKGLQDGTIDCIASDHAPHAVFEKEQEFDVAPFGVIGVQTMVSVIFTELVAKNKIILERAIQAMSYNPATILGLDRGRLDVGSIADVVIIDPKKEITVTADWLYGRSKNSAFLGRKLMGIATITIVAGKIVVNDGKLV
ncbi:MAG: dihydroorotase [bacterium]|nr:dihydroorotase [bacterium]